MVEIILPARPLPSPSHQLIRRIFSGIQHTTYSIQHTTSHNIFRATHHTGTVHVQLSPYLFSIYPILSYTYTYTYTHTLLIPTLLVSLLVYHLGCLPIHFIFSNPVSKCCYITLHPLLHSCSLRSSLFLSLAFSSSLSLYSGRIPPGAEVKRKKQIILVSVDAPSPPHHRPITSEYIHPPTPCGPPVSEKLTDEQGTSNQFLQTICATKHYRTDSIKRDPAEPSSIRFSSRPLLSLALAVV